MTGNPNVTEPTLDVCLRTWGEPAMLQRSPPIPLEGLFTSPDSLRRFGGISVDTVDASFTARTAEVVALDIQPDERVVIREQPYHVVALLEDDGAGVALLLRRLIA
jgi:hypothetical protein